MIHSRVDIFRCFGQSLNYRKRNWNLMHFVVPSTNCNQLRVNKSIRRPLHWKGRVCHDPELNVRWDRTKSWISKIPLTFIYTSTSWRNPRFLFFLGPSANCVERGLCSKKLEQLGWLQVHYTQPVGILFLFSISMTIVFLLKIGSVSVSYLFWSHAKLNVIMNVKLL